MGVSLLISYAALSHAVTGLTLLLVQRVPFEANLLCFLRGWPRRRVMA